MKLIDLLRSEHPGCGLAKAYDTLRPSFIGRDRFIEFFSEMGYRVKLPKSFIKTTIPGTYVYPNLIEGRIVDRINQVVQSDITYILVQNQFYYAVFIIDVFSKRIVGYQVSDHLRATANLKAFRQLIKLRGATNLVNLIHHSDRGSQYSCKAYRQLLYKTQCLISMDQSAQQNAYAERVNGIIKNEYLTYWAIQDLNDLKRKLNRAVKHYNFERIHRHLPDKLSPVQFELKWPKSTKLRQHQELIYSPNNYVSRAKQKSFFKQMQKANGPFCPIFIQ